MLPHDPVDMRQQAAAVRSAADQVAEMVERLQRRIDDMEFEAPAATRIRAAVGEQHLRSRTAVADLQAVAERMLHEAHAIEQRVAGGHGLA